MIWLLAKNKIRPPEIPLSIKVSITNILWVTYDKKVIISHLYIEREKLIINTHLIIVYLISMYMVSLEKQWPSKLVKHWRNKEIKK